MAFEKGKSGNPRGRPAKGRALAEILAKAGNKKVKNSEGKDVTRKEMLADMLWEASLTGTVEFLGKRGGHIVVDSMQEWFTIGKFVHTHLDGPVRPEIEMPGGGNITFQLSVVERRAETEDDPSEDDDPDGED